MGFLIADAAYFFSALLDGLALLLAFDWLLKIMPGAGLNSARRFLFRACFPVLKWGGRLFFRGALSPETGGLWLAVLLAVVSRFGVPWLILLGYSLRG